MGVVGRLGIWRWLGRGEMEMSLGWADAQQCGRRLSMMGWPGEHAHSLMRGGAAEGGVVGGVAMQGAAKDQSTPGARTRWWVRGRLLRRGFCGVISALEGELGR